MVKKQFKVGSLVLALSMGLVACGGSSSDTEGSSTENQSSNQYVSNGTMVKAQFIDSEVQGLDVYQDNKLVSTTDKNGYFMYDFTKVAQFKVGQLVIGEANLGEKSLTINGDTQVVTPLEIAKDSKHMTEILVTLQSLDKDNNPENGIEIAKNNPQKPIEKLAVGKLADSTAQDKLKDILPSSTQYVLPEKAKQHYENTLKKVVERAKSSAEKSPADLLVGTWKSNCKQVGVNGVKPDGSPNYIYDALVLTVTKVNATTINMNERTLVYKDESCTQLSKEKPVDTYESAVNYIGTDGQNTVLKVDGSLFNVSSHAISAERERRSFHRISY